MCDETVELYMKMKGMRARAKQAIIKYYTWGYTSQLYMGLYQPVIHGAIPASYTWGYTSQLYMGLYQPVIHGAIPAGCILVNRSGVRVVYLLERYINVLFHFRITGVGPPQCLSNLATGIFA